MVQKFEKWYFQTGLGVGSWAKVQAKVGDQNIHVLSVTQNFDFFVTYRQTCTWTDQIFLKSSIFTLIIHQYTHPRCQKITLKLQLVPKLLCMFVL